MERLLCIVGGMNAGGAETFLMKIYRNLNRAQYQMDFCVSKSEKGFYDDEIMAMGGKIIHTVSKSGNLFVSFSTLYKIVKEGKYTRVMRVSQHSLAALDLVIAKFAGAKVRVFRSSNSNTNKGGVELFLHKIFKFLPRIIPTVKIAPSKEAAKFTFGNKAAEKDVLYLNNGIPLKEYTYDDVERRRIRAEIGVDDNFLVGHIGRFANQKNHKELIEIFARLLEKQPSAHLMLIGEGELEQDIKENVESRGLSGRVHFMGVRKDVPALLSAMDVFVFPSFFEGMPNTVIEAQANGLPCVISDAITKDVKMCKNVSMLPLLHVQEWVDEICRNSNRLPSADCQNILIEHGYDISEVTKTFVSAVFEKEGKLR